MRTYTYTLIYALVLCCCAGCSQDSGGNPDGMGKLRVSLTDAPFPIELVEEANVTITRIEIRGEDFITIFEDSLRFNLLDLQNGVSEQLVNIDIPAGTYDLVRMVVTEPEIVLTDSSVFEMTVPSGAQSGLKIFIKPAIEVVGGLSSELLLDFELDKSFVVQGNPETPAGIRGFTFKPVVRAVNMSTAGEILGQVQDDTTGSAIGQAEVWIEQDTVVATTFSDDSGFFNFKGVLDGSYILHATKADYDSASQAIEVVAGNQTQQNLQLSSTL